jgi:phage baseplate assembly protein W
MAVFFKGFSTIDKDHKNNALTDIELVKRDLLNHFHTRKGERVMMPEFGSIIWDMLFEPLIEANVELIKDDVRRIVSSDTRVTLDSFNVTEVSSGLELTIGLIYAPTGAYVTFSETFDKNSADRF